jgi:hypothetical protein
MALTVTTDLTIITTAETATGWTIFGSGGGGVLLEPDFFVQGANCVSRAVSGAGTLKGGTFLAGTLNYTTTHAGKLVYIWLRVNTAQLIDTRANGGLRIVIGSGATSPAAAAGAWSAWYVDGSDTIPAETGWRCYVIDPTLPPSTSFGTLDLTDVRHYGAVILTTATAKGQNLGIDQISYGLGELRCRGAPAVAGAGFAEMLAADYGTIANRYGILTERGGIIYAQGKVVIGDAVSTNTTDFTSEDETIVWERRTYWDGTSERACVKDVNPNTGLAYHGLDLRGNGSGDTNVTLGVKVGTGDAASGRSGPSFLGHRGYVAFDLDDGSVEAVKIYGTTFRQLRGGIDMSGNGAADEFVGNIVTGCGTFQAGPVEVRACNFIANLGGAAKIFEDFMNDAAGAEALATADPLKVWDNVLNGSNFSCPVKVPYVELLDPGAGDRREVVQLNAIDSASLTVTVVAAGGTYTRSAGSYLTDGFRVGQSVTWSGFTNAGNNATKVIFVLTATVMTTATAGLVDETGDGNERVIDSSGVGSDDHFAEAIIRWPSAGANQGSLGVTIRGAAGATENYYYLRCDLLNDQITLIRCDAGADTTIDGPDTFNFVEDADYLVHLIGRGTLIEGFVNGTKVAVSGQSSYQTNRRVGIRGDAEADQTGDAPRLSKFGCGPTTGPFGAIALVSATDDLQTSNFINNLRAVALGTTGTYDLTNNNFAGNLVDIRDDSSGATTINNVSTGGAPTIKEQVDDAVTTIVTAVSIAVHVQDEASVSISDAQVYVQKTAPTAYTSGVGNTAGNGTLVLTQTIDSDTPQIGSVNVFDVSLNAVQTYRYASHNGASTLTFVTEVTFACTGGGTSTSLQDSVHDFTVLDIKEGDAVRNTTDGSWAVVLTIVSATQITTSPLQGGGDNTWTSGDTYSFNRLATTLVSGTDTADIPILMASTNASGNVSKSFPYVADRAVTIRVRSVDGATKYVPVKATGNILTTGMSVSVVLPPDPVFA